MKDDQFWRYLFYHMGQFAQHGPTGVPSFPNTPISNNLHASPDVFPVHLPRSDAQSSSLLDTPYRSSSDASAMDSHNAAEQMRSQLAVAHSRLSELSSQLEQEKQRSAALQVQLE